MKNIADVIRKIFERNQDVQIRFKGIGEKPKKIELYLELKNPDITIQELSGFICSIASGVRKYKKKIEFIIFYPTDDFVYSTKSLTISKKTSMYKVLEKLVEMINDEPVSSEAEALEKAGETVSAIFE